MLVTKGWGHFNHYKTLQSWKVSDLSHCCKLIDNSHRERYDWATPFRDLLRHSAYALAHFLIEELIKINWRQLWTKLKQVSYHYHILNFLVQKLNKINLRQLWTQLKQVSYHSTRKIDHRLWSIVQTNGTLGLGSANFGTAKSIPDWKI